MRLRKARLTGTIAFVATVGLALAGCAGSGSASGEGEIELVTNMAEGAPQLEVLTSLAEEFTKEHPETPIKVAPGTSSYEADLKVRLASNDAPDIFMTHGWSLLRYAQFLEPLQSQPWAKDVDPALDVIMKTETGELYALPITSDLTGIVYNADVLEAAGVDPATLTTWDAFNEAAAKIAANGVIPISSSGKDNWLAGADIDWILSGAFDEAQLTDLTEGTFVPEGFTETLTLIDSWREDGYFNPDYASATTDDIAKSLAAGQTAFVLVQNYVATSALTFNPDVNVGFMPVPSFQDADPYLIAGEGIALGVSKSSPRKKAALEFLDLLAQPENVSAMAAAAGAPPGLTNADVDLGPLTESFETYVASGDYPVVPYFDRVYLPNGAWNSIVTAADSVITGQAKVAAAVELVEADFSTLYGQ